MATVLIEVDKNKVQALGDALKEYDVTDVSEFPDHTASSDCIVLRLEMSDAARDKLFEKHPLTGETNLFALNKQFLPETVDTRNTNDRFRAMQEQLDKAMAELARVTSLSSKEDTTPVARKTTRDTTKPE